MSPDGRRVVAFRSQADIEAAFGASTATEAMPTRDAASGPYTAPPEAPEPQTSMQPDGRGKIPTCDLARAILDEGARFAVDAGRLLHVFQDGRYVEGAAFVHSRIKAILDRSGRLKSWSSHRSQEVVRFLEIDSPHLWLSPPEDTICVANGLLYLPTGELRPHNPDWLSSVQLPVHFDPAARYPEWEEFITGVFGDAEEIAWELPAWLMAPSRSIQSAVLLSGEGANGKSSYLEALRQFLGPCNVSAVTLQRLEADRFAPASLVGKLANIVADLPATPLEGSSMFKAITGGDTIMAERKYGHPFPFTPFARLVFSCNAFPRSPDASPAFFRRWVVVPFLRRFDAGAAGTRRREDLDAALSHPTELSGVLNRALLARRTLKGRGTLSESASMRAAHEELCATTDPLLTWLNCHLEYHPEGFVRREAVLHAYNRACDQDGRNHMTASRFGTAFKKHFPKVEVAQRTFEGKPHWAYVGIRYREVHS